MRKTSQIILNPSLASYGDFVRSIPKRFEVEGETIYRGRNLIKVFDVDGRCVNVKRYREPRFFNKLAYTFARKSKAERAFEYAGILNGMGISTPPPIAIILCRDAWGLLAESYLVTEQSALRRNFYEFAEGDLQSREAIIRGMAAFAADMHEKGVLHKDFSPGNILFDLVDGKPAFAIVDINRMKFGNVGMAEGCANFARLWGRTKMFEWIAEEYASVRHFDAEACLRLTLRERDRFWRNYGKRHLVGFEME